MTGGYMLAFVPLSLAAVIDADRRMIPDQTVFLIACCALFDLGAGAASVPAMLAGVILLGGLLLAGAVCTDGIGGGDVKLSAALGALLGPHRGLLMLLLSLVLLITAGKLSHQPALPFAPFILGAFYIYAIVSTLL